MRIKLLDKNSSPIEQYDLIMLNDQKFLITKIGKTQVDIFPIDIFLEDDIEDKLILKLSVEHSIVNQSQKLDSCDLLYLINESNPIIKRALHELFYERD